MPIKRSFRKLKWVGEAPILMPDKWRVAIWKHENARLLALVGFCTLKITPEAMPGLSRAYTWGMKKNGLVSQNPADMIQDVDAVDAALILQYQSGMIVDVTDEADPLSVRVKPIIVYEDPKNPGKYVRSN